MNAPSSPVPQEIRSRIPTLRAIPLPKDSNPAGDVFGGWMLSQMDLAGASCAYRFARRRIVTVGIEAMAFHEPVFIGDEVSFYAEIVRVGRTSITVKIDSLALRREGFEYVKVTEGLFTYVAIDDARRPVPVGAGAGGEANS